MEAVPEDGAKQGEEAGEAVAPAVEEGLEAKQQVEEQGGPDLPAHSVGAVAEEIAQLEGLFDLLEEDLDLPAAAVQVGHGGRGPLEVVGKKLHDDFFAVEFDPGGDAAHSVGILAAGIAVLQDDLVVAQDVAGRLA